VRKRRMLVHHDGEAQLAGRRGLDNHRVVSRCGCNQWLGSICGWIL
jgi:hypothetical protein